MGVYRDVGIYQQSALAPVPESYSDEEAIRHHTDLKTVTMALQCLADGAVYLIDWYFPWQLIDWVLRLQLIVWLAAVGVSYWIFWRSVVKKRAWLQKNNSNNR